MNLMANSSQTTLGRLGVLVALPAGGELPAGSTEVLTVNLIAAQPGVFTFSLGDQQVSRSVSDSLAAELPASHFGTTLKVLPMNPIPSLAIERATNEVILSWPLWASDFGLQMTEPGNGPQGPWTHAPGLAETNGQILSVILPIESQPKYFRLFRP